uniref:RNA-dependent RNA polymerase n=1 Tax=Phanerodontia chrysosporium TaxID=2822231 RepID=Q01869_PHACH|nr:unnamed protein product [Phanerodontia chrysosporium]
MDIYMAHIGFSVTREHLKTEIARVLHSPEYQHHRGVQFPMNFEVIIHKKKGTSPFRSGILTVPTPDIGAHFLRDFGGGTPMRRMVLGTRIFFQPGNKQPRPHVLEEIRRAPYVDPREEDDRRRVATELREKTIALRTVQFGWECRDNVFSVEWERVCDARCELYYHEERREFHIKLYQGTRTKIISIKASHIAWTSAGLDKTTQPPLPILFFTLNHPPAYETEMSQIDMTLQLLEFMGISDSSEGLLNMPMLSPGNALRDRWSHFEDSQKPYAPFVSTTIRLICREREHLSLFRDLCSHARMQTDDYLYPVEYRELFAPDVQERYEQWVRRLPWKVAFQVEALVRGLLVDMKEALALRAKISRMVQAKGEAYTSVFLRHFATQAKTLFWYTDDSRSQAGSVDDLFTRCEREYVPVKRRRLRGPPNQDIFDCLHVTVTPTTHRLDGPYPERSNRVMRMYPDYHDCFVRINFVDETDLQFRFDREVDGRAFIKRRVGEILTNGIDIAGRHFEFLAYSQSALKEHAVWFVKEFMLPNGTIVNARTIIAGLGDFTRDHQLIYCPARYGARISQAFTATDSSVKVQPDEVFEIDDIEGPTGTWCFTSGVGTMSVQLARDIWKKLAARRGGSRWKTYPRALQIRFRGSKGMLSVDHTLQGRAICLRPSMIKFEAPESLTDIEIARAFNRPGPFYLNRPLIMIMEHLGVPYEVFEELQDMAVEEAQESVESLEKAARLLETFGLGASYRLTSIFLSLHKLGVGPLTGDEFWQKMMDFAINHVLRELKHHARIPVPNAWNLVGVADVHGYLEQDEVFGCIYPLDGTGPIYLDGPTLVTRSPTIHPGDVQVAHGIGRPPRGSPFEHESLRNTLVFSTKGSSANFDRLVFFSIHPDDVFRFASSPVLSRRRRSGRCATTSDPFLIFVSLLTDKATNTASQCLKTCCRPGHMPLLAIRLHRKSC